MHSALQQRVARVAVKLATLELMELGVVSALIITARVCPFVCVCLAVESGVDAESTAFSMTVLCRFFLLTKLSIRARLSYACIRLQASFCFSANCQEFSFLMSSFPVQPSPSYFSSSLLHEEYVRLDLRFALVPMPSHVDSHHIASVCVCVCVLSLIHI